MTDTETPTPGPAYCDGHSYENVTTYDLADTFDRWCFARRLDTFIDWFEDADEVYADENGKHRHFEINDIEVRCNVQQLSKRFRNVYWTAEYHGDDQ